MSESGVNLRPCRPGDLPAVNAIIASGVMGWQLSDRVKRLSIPLYQYDRSDLDHLRIQVAECGGRILAVAAWDHAPEEQLLPGRTGFLLHGLYVAPEARDQGLGAALLDACQQAAADAGLDGVLVKAQADSAGYFVARGLERLPVTRVTQDYALRFWLPVDTG